MGTDADSALSGLPLPDDSARWHRLLARLNLDELTETFVTRLPSVRGYDPLPVPRAEVRRTGRLSFETLLQSLRDGEFRSPLDVANDVGVSRARADVPLSSLMSAIRLDFSVLWEALTRVAAPEDAELIIRHTGIVLQTVEDYASQTQQAYLTERQRMRDEANSVQQGLIASLFQDPYPPPERLGAIAAELGLDAAEPLVVAAAVTEDVPGLRVVVSEVSQAGATVYTHHRGDALIAFTRQLQFPVARSSLLKHRLGEARLGVAYAGLGLAELRQAAAAAVDLAQLFAPHETGAMTWERGWARMAAQELAAAGHGILQDVHRSLADCGEAERERLEESVRSYLRTGSIGQSAQELFCHRNTLANRLRRFTDLTGVDPTVPEQAARLVVGWA